MADANAQQLAPGWVKMQDQYGDYYINLYNKQTSRIRPVRVDNFDQGALPPPPPAPDDNADQPPQANGVQSPVEQPLSPHSQQQATQQQMYNQQLYQQQWQAYYAQQQWQQQQQQQMGQQQQQMSPQQMAQMSPQQQQQYYQQQQMQQMHWQQQQMMQKQYNNNPQMMQNGHMNGNGNEEESSSSTGSDSTGSETESEESVTVADTVVVHDNEDEKSQLKPSQIQQQPIQVPQSGTDLSAMQISPMQQPQQPMSVPQSVSENVSLQQMKPKQVPPINNENNENNIEISPKHRGSNANGKYSFQPIVPHMNINQSNDDYRQGSISQKNEYIYPQKMSISQKIDISPAVSNHNSYIGPMISNNHSLANDNSVANSAVNSALPSPAFNPNKLGMLANNVDFTGNLPPSQEQPAEGTNAPAAYGQMNDNDVAAPAPVIDKQQSTIFGVMLKSADKKAHLQREENWEMLVDGVEQNCAIQDQYDVFKAMRKVTKNLLMDDEKYRTLYADNDMVQKKILGRVGGYEFLRGIGFKQGMDDNELVCMYPDQSVIQLAITALEKRITNLKQRRHEWDPKYKMRGNRGGMGGMNRKGRAPQGGGGGGNNKPANQSEEDRMLQEALRASQQSHVQDMLSRQQRELDFAKRQNFGKSQNLGQSVNIYGVREEDDQKKPWE